MVSALIRLLEDSVDRFGHDHEFTKLVIDLKGKDPDDAFSSIPYEKVGFHEKQNPVHSADLYRASTSFTTWKSSLASHLGIHSFLTISPLGSRSLSTPTISKLLSLISSSRTKKRLKLSNLLIGIRGFTNLAYLLNLNLIQAWWTDATL
jgi:hypothetical protein